MLELARHLLDRMAEGRRVAVVTVTGVAHSAPRGIGASMAVCDDAEVIGSISGGCVEGDSIELAHRVLAGGPARAARFGFDDETAHAAGLACGGQIDVLTFALHDDDVTRSALKAAADGRSATVGLVLEGPDVGRIVAADDGELAACALLAETRVIGSSPRVLALSRAPRPRLIIAGATDHAAALCRVGAAAGFAVTIVDPWQLLVTAERFPD
ncbi:MAG: XdhC family protein, partial [Microbacterium sp.]